MSECLYEVDSESPVHIHSDGTWWFYEETWVDEHGPYETEAICREQLKDYCNIVLGGRYE